MPGTQTTQTRRIKRALLAAGYTMKEISVRTHCNHRGEYQPTSIMIRAKLARQEKLLSAVLATNEVDVAQYLFIHTTTGELKRHYIYSECLNERSTFSVHDLTYVDLVKTEKEN